MEEDENPDPLLEDAMDWLLRLEESRGDLETFRRFELWLSRSPSHRQAWNRARRTWKLLGKVPPAYEHLWNDEPARHVSQRRTGLRRHVPGARPAAAAAAVLAVVVLALSAPAIMLHWRADYMTATAESRVISLKDGTVVTLAADSAIAADVGDTGRRLTLLSGEAFLDVAHDQSRPFVVEAGGVDISVLGTAFDVRLSDGAIAVELARGAVRVGQAMDGTPQAATLAPEEMIVVDRASGAMRTSAIAAEDIGAWRDGRIFVDDATVGSVVERLQRYHPAWIKIPDPGLADRRVTGLYDLGDPDRALEALVRPFGGKVRKISPYLRVLSRF